MNRLSWNVLVCGLIGFIGVGPLVARDVIEAKTNVEVVRVLHHVEIVRPIVVTHAGDGSDRLFIASQYGTIYSLNAPYSENDPEEFLDIQERVTYNDRQNEEGFLGMAFHPKFKENGLFYVYYTTTEKPHVSVVSQFSVKKDDPTQADPGSEVEVMRIPQPFWNHNGGTIAFGEDGKLYIALGDGGAGNDPMGNGQNLETWLGAILRIDVDQKDEGKGYGIPKDNPFVDRNDAKPEIWAYGLRNVWRMSFDRDTGHCWVGDVGQDVWEEVNVIVKGGNYGWNLREGQHQFKESGVDASDKFVEPIYEYDHEVGKSITGGNVYRGSKLPELEGVYLYGDYVSGKIWGLKYDYDKKEATAHYTFETETPIAVITFGEDEAGEVYFTDAAGRIFSFAK